MWVFMLSACTDFFPQTSHASIIPSLTGRGMVSSVCLLEMVGKSFISQLCWELGMILETLLGNFVVNVLKILSWEYFEKNFTWEFLKKNFVGRFLKLFLGIFLKKIWLGNLWKFSWEFWKKMYWECFAIFPEEFLWKSSLKCHDLKSKPVWL